MSTSVAETTDLAQQLDRVAITFSEATLTVLDLVLLGMLRGDWWELERRARRGLALRREGGNAVSKPDLHAAATSFRYAHHLVSAEDFQSWLRARRLGVGDLAAYLQRRLRGPREISWSPRTWSPKPRPRSGGRARPMSRPTFLSWPRPTPQVVPRPVRERNCTSGWRGWPGCSWR